MTVYVDNMRAPFGRMIMCHMISDSEAEMHAMADSIGVARKWFQGDHYDIALSKRAIAIRNGAVEVTRRQLGLMLRNRRKNGSLGDPFLLEAEYERAKPASQCSHSEGRGVLGDQLEMFL
jgi:hypothetical protein